MMARIEQHDVHGRRLDELLESVQAPYLLRVPCHLSGFRVLPVCADGESAWEFHVDVISAHHREEFALYDCVDSAEERDKIRHILNTAAITRSLIIAESEVFCLVDGKMTLYGATLTIFHRDRPADSHGQPSATMTPRHAHIHADKQVVLAVSTMQHDPEGERLLEVGCLELQANRPTGRVRHWYLNPQIPVDSLQDDLPGTADAVIADRPTFADIADELLGFLSGAYLLTGNDSATVAAVNSELARLGRCDTLERYCQSMELPSLISDLGGTSSQKFFRFFRRHNSDGMLDYPRCGTLACAYLFWHTYRYLVLSPS